MTTRGSVETRKGDVRQVMEGRREEGKLYENLGTLSGRLNGRMR
jgi:hypothetical protein